MIRNLHKTLFGVIKSKKMRQAADVTHAGKSCKEGQLWKLKGVVWNQVKITVGSCCEHTDERLDSTRKGNCWTN